MLANIGIMLKYFAAHYNDIIVNVVIMVSAVIVAIGILKPFIFNRITNKHVRKAVLAFSNVAGCFIAALIYFLVRDWNFAHYPLAALALSVVCVMTYWLYENTCLRNLIEVVGGIALRKALSILGTAVTNDDVNAVKTEYKNAVNHVRTQTKVELKKVVSKAQTDKDLRNL